ncbi:hypothetical protein HDU85_002607 [Gaertneriomyces sp. JEL0708]|nr:hypothetical protein HDU85_002607 [Gaertneriomyces sp. JEL0708]
MKLRCVVPACFALASASVVLADGNAKSSAVFEPTKVTGPFVEQFDAGWQKRWIASEAKKSADDVEDEELLRYRGEWAVEEALGSHIEGDKGLVLKTAAAHHAISAKFDKPIDPKGKPLVVQYEVKLQNGLECGGAYVKLLSQDAAFDPKHFENKTPYTIMFGPDKCGLTNKVHFIFRHKNPITGVFEEKHTVQPPVAKIDKQTHLYTLIVNPDQTFQILIDNKEAKKGSLLSDFNPAVNPPKELDDPEDVKPEDWVDEAEIPDPEAKKPDDWDDDAPMQIPDEDANVPDGWLVDEPPMIPDPDAEKPEDWDDEEDGDWVAPLVANPKCDTVPGCGEWYRPLKKNPNYKGKWKAPMIANPAFKGEWTPRKVPNPEFFEDKTPSNFNKIGAIGFELWSIQNGTMFDNIYIGHSAADAQKLAQETWAIKADIEKADEPAKPVADADLPMIEQIKAKVLDFINAVRQNPVEAVKSAPEVAGGLAAAALLPVLLSSFLFGGSSSKSQPATTTKKTTKVEVKKAANGTASDVSSDEEPVVVAKEEKKTTKKRSAAKSKKDDSE